MSKQTINIGASPNDGTGTPLRTSFDYTNQNFTELYTALGGGVGLPGATTQVIFNDGGTNLAGDAGLVYNKTTDALTVAGLVTAGSATITGALTVDTTTLVVDATNDRVGIGTASPNARLDVNGTVIIRDTFQLLMGFGNQQRILAGGGSDNTYQTFSQWTGAAYTERLRINATGNLVLTGGTAAANGVGLTFPATQVASSDANCLDDYEEGTFSPTVTAQFGTIGTTTVVSANYTKIGRLVSVDFDIIVVTAGTGSGSLLVSLPFTSGVEACGAGRESVNTGNMCQVFRNTATDVGVRFYNNLTVITNLNRVICSYTYNV